MLLIALILHYFSDIINAIIITRERLWIKI